MEITARGMNIIYRNADIRFQKALRPTAAWSVSSGILEILPLQTLKNEQYWLARLPAMQRWTKDKIINNLSTHGQWIESKPWELSFAIKRDHVKYDQYGLINQSVDQASDRASKQTDYALADFLQQNPTKQFGSDEPMCYDGQPFFSTLHPTSGGDITKPVPSSVPATQSNLLLNTPLTVTNFQTAISTMMSYVDETGRPWGAIPDTLIVGPALRHVGRQICESPFIADIASAAGASATVSASSVAAVQSNVEQGITKLVVVPDLYYAPGSWMLACTKGILKPFVWGQLEAPHMIPSVNPTDPNVFLKAEFWYSIEAHGEIAPTLWPLCLYATSGSSYGT